MSSSAWTPQEGQVSSGSISAQAQPSDSTVVGSAVGPQSSAVAPTLSGQPLRGPDVGATSQVPASPTPPSGPSTTNGPPPVGSLSTPISRSNDVTATEASQDSVRAKFIGSAGYVVPAPSFSYSVFPRVNSSPANPQQSVSSPVVRITPPVPPSALQPPVPGQPSALRPSFSYTIISQTSASPATSQQFQPSTVVGSTSPQGKTLMPSPAAPTVQPSVAGQSPAMTSTLPGTATQNPATSVQLPSSTSFSYSGNTQAGAVDSEKAVSSNLNTSSAIAAEPVAATTATFSSQSLRMPAHVPPNFSTNLPSSLNLNPATIQTSTISSFPRPPGMPGNAGLGPPRLASSMSPSSNATMRPAQTDSSSARPILPSPASTPLNPVSAPAPIRQNLQQQKYPPHPSMIPQASPPQGLWLHASHAGSLQHAPFLPYPGAIPAPFPMPMQGLPPPYGHLPSLQPPGVSTIVISGEAQSASTESVQPVNNFVAQSPSSGIDSKHATDATIKDENNAKKEDSDAWTAHKTDSGATYYYNSHTGESTYEKPSCFKGEPGNVIVQPTPVSWEKLAGTDWTLVTTNDAKKYYYNSITKVSSWQIPPEVVEMKKNDDDDPSTENANSIENAGITSDKGLSNVSLNAPAVQTGGRDATSSKTPGALISASALDLIKKKLQDAGTPATSSPLPTPVQTLSESGSKEVEAAKAQHGENSKDKLKDTNGDANISESSSDSDDEDSGPTKDECIIQFKEMLKERGVAPFSKWEKELPKIIFDPRFKAVQSHSVRRSLFEHYVRTRAEEERKEKRAAQKAAIEGFKQLLDEASEDINHRTDYQTFKRKWGSDFRFEALGRKERELLLSERINSLKKVVEEKMQAIRADFKSMLRERAEITGSSRWSRVKDSLRNDPRYRSAKHEDRELFFNEYISELKAAEAEAQLAAKAKMEEQEKLKRREQEMRKRKQREEQEMEAVRLRVRRKEAESSYQALLVETIKDPKASWTESKPKLEKDPQGRATNPDLDQADMEKLFREHVKNLYERCAREYRVLLAEVITAEAAARVADDGKTVLTSWSEAKKLLRPDPRYSKMPSKDRESLWSRHADDLRRKLKSAHDPKERSDVEAKVRASSTDLGGRSPKRSRSSRQM